MGVLEAPRYPEHVVELERGSTLVLYTDGLVEEPTEVLDIGLARLLEAARGAEGDDVEELCEVLLEKGLPPSARHPDDVTLLVLRAQEVLGDTVELEVSGEPGALKYTRDTLRLWLSESDATQDETDDITMACNEACENVVEHAYGLGADPFNVAFARDGRDISIRVRDRGTWQGDTTPDRGLGLELMRRLVDDVDVQSGPNGTTVRLSKRLAYILYIYYRRRRRSERAERDDGAVRASGWRKPAASSAGRGQEGRAALGLAPRGVRGQAPQPTSSSMSSFDPCMSSTVPVGRSCALARALVSRDRGAMPEGCRAAPMHGGCCIKSGSCRPTGSRTMLG